MMGLSSYLALPGTETLYLVCWWHPGFGHHPTLPPSVSHCTNDGGISAQLSSFHGNWNHTQNSATAWDSVYLPGACQLLPLGDGSRLPTFYPCLRPETNRLTTRDYDTSPLTLVSIASRTFSDKRAGPLGHVHLDNFLSAIQFCTWSLEALGPISLFPHTQPHNGEERDPECPTPNLPVIMGSPCHHARFPHTHAQSVVTTTAWK